MPSLSAKTTSESPLQKANACEPISLTDAGIYTRSRLLHLKNALSGIFDSLRPEYWPTAVIAMNDLMAMGCQAEARERGILMPDQLSIVGCDDLFCAPYLCPALTSINLHQQRTGARAVQLLISGENKHEIGDWELVERASCARLTK